MTSRKYTKPLTQLEWNKLSYSAKKYVKSKYPEYVKDIMSIILNPRRCENIGNERFKLRMRKRKEKILKKEIKIKKIKDEIKKIDDNIGELEQLIKNMSINTKKNENKKVIIIKNKTFKQ